MSTYLQLVNDVLIRLRETEVNSVQDNLYSKLIGKLINDSKRRVENAFDWNALGSIITVTTVSGTTNYSIVGSGSRFRTLQVLNTTNKYQLINAPVNQIDRDLLISTVTNTEPTYYAFNGVDSSGDTKVDLYPTPNGTYTIKFSLIVPQVDLSADADILTIPSDAVIQGAYAVAVAERGEDNGLASSEAALIYRSILADAIAQESGRYVENECWVAT